MGWFARKRRLRMARHGIAFTVLVSFAVGNIGWPLSAATGKCRSIAGKSMCCCGDSAKAGNCGCGKGSASSARTGRGCCASDSKSSPFEVAAGCQKKQQKPEPVQDLAFKCACGDSPIPGFLISSQPKLQSAPLTIPELVKTAYLSSPAACAVPASNLAPETPPPRPSVA